MKTIHKYPLQVKQETLIPMNEHAQILTVQMQNQVPCLWVLTDTEKPLVTKAIELYGTGHDVPDSDTARTYIGTFQMHGGSLVFHVFERFIVC